jgi:hypothetical protein
METCVQKSFDTADIVRDVRLARLGKMTDAELIAFGKEMRELVYPLACG